MTLPEAFVQRTKLILKEEFGEFENALSTPPPTSIRINSKLDYKPSEGQVPWCTDGYYLPERPLFTADPFFHAGVYYVQEASSMFLAQAVKQHFPKAEIVLDLCAAPGGKSTLLSQALPESSLLVSNEIIHSRAYILAENLIKWGNPNIVVTNNEPKDFEALGGYFDAMVIDAPCSGEGMFRKDNGAIAEWSEYNVKMCAERQREIVASVWDSLQENGILVYSTCTFNREENEDNISWICDELGAELLRIDIKEFPQVVESDKGYRFYPHKVSGEGFFLSVLRKTSMHGSLPKQKSDNKKSVTKTDYKNEYLLNKEAWKIVSENNIISAFASNRFEDITLLKKYLKCMHAGIVLAEQKGHDFIPNISLALSKHLDKTQVVSVELDYKTAISYLKKETINLPDTPKGYVLVSFKNQPLGWVKNLGNRSNNLYPQNWRIRMNL